MCVKIKGNIYKSRVNQLTSQIISDWKKMCFEKFFLAESIDQRTVKLVYKVNSREPNNMVFISSCSLYVVKFICTIHEQEKRNWSL
jgi:hypothetical protein